MRSSDEYPNYHGSPKRLLHVKLTFKSTNFEHSVMLRHGIQVPFVTPNFQYELNSDWLSLARKEIVRTIYKPL